MQMDAQSLHRCLALMAVGAVRVAGRGAEASPELTFHTC